MYNNEKNILSIIMPTYNEELTINQITDLIKNHVDHFINNTDILIYYK